MEFKEELEILRGEPIKVFSGDPMDIPCIETSDAEKLCKNPVVSVHMITYNHEPYIRQAIEGVMMQKTDFEFELVIGEDASTDKTREICFEYQKKYPDKIRVLWWHENLRKVDHPAGGNSDRVMAHCRGELIAFCEGDDYWIDATKLQRQFDVMQAYPRVSMCCHQFQVLKHGAFSQWNKERLKLLTARGGDSYGFLFKKEDFFIPGIFTQTATVLIRKEQCDWNFYYRTQSRCDITLFYACLKRGKGYFINRTMSVYRITDGGMWQGRSENERAKFHLTMVRSIVKLDSNPVTIHMLSIAKRKLRMTKFPFRNFKIIYDFLRKELSIVKRMVHGIPG